MLKEISENSNQVIFNETKEASLFRIYKISSRLSFPPDNSHCCYGRTKNYKLAEMMNNRDEKLINKIVHLMETDDSIDAPRDSVKWAKNIFRARLAAQPEKSVIQKVLAVLRMDLSPNKAAFGERSASAAKARQMLFQAGDVNGVDLRIGKSDQNFAVRGQILGAGFANCSVKLNEFETTANELSEFSFSNVPSGKYDLTLQTGATEITIENLEIE
jgi:hypothetical protein